MKSLCRLVGWTEGSFELEPPQPTQFDLELEDKTETLLMEALRQLDEYRRIEPELPPTNARYQMAHPLEVPLSTLSPVQLDILQLVHNQAELQAVLDQAPSSDLDTALAFLHLFKGGFLAPA
jgi:hypothetical protein